MKPTVLYWWMCARVTVGFASVGVSSRCEPILRFLSFIVLKDNFYLNFYRKKKIIQSIVFHRCVVLRAIAIVSVFVFPGVQKYIWFSLSGFDSFEGNECFNSFLFVIFCSVWFLCFSVRLEAFFFCYEYISYSVCLCKCECFFFLHSKREMFSYINNNRLRIAACNI